MTTKKTISLAAVMLAAAACIDSMDFYSVSGAASGTEGATSGAGGGAGGGVGCEPGVVAPCYAGPKGTEGVGLCKAGEKTCDADGTSSRGCEGEVVPQPENCATPVDEDCDGLAPACTGVVLWSKRFGDENNQLSQSVVTDSAGNVLIAGVLGPHSGVTFGGGALVNAGMSDLFIVKLDRAGAHLWSKRFGDDKWQADIGVAVDAVDNILVTGAFLGSVDFGGGPLTAGSGGAVFVAKLDAFGNFLWAKSFDNATPHANSYISRAPALPRTTWATSSLPAASMNPWTSAVARSRALAIRIYSSPN